MLQQTQAGQSQINKYLEARVQTASPAQLFLMLNDGAIRFCKLGIEAIQKGNDEEAHHNLCRVQDILAEFVITLDRRSPMAEGLLQLYDFMIHRLVEANTKKVSAPAEEVLQFLSELKATWMEAAKSIHAGSQPAVKETGVQTK